MEVLLRFLYVLYVVGAYDYPYFFLQLVLICCNLFLCAHTVFGGYLFTEKFEGLQNNLV